jgi:hypothetical protein
MCARGGAASAPCKKERRYRLIMTSRAASLKLWLPWD